MNVHSAGSILPSMSSSEPVFGQRTSPINQHILQHGRSDQESLKSIAQLFLECLDRFRHDIPGMRYDTYKRIIHICLEEILASYQSEVVNEGTCSNIGDQSIPQTPVAFNDVSHLPSTDLPVVLQSMAFQHLGVGLPGQEYGMLPQGYPSVTGAPPEGMGIPFHQTFPAFVSTSSSVSYELGQPLHSPAPRNIACTDGQILPGPSANHNQEPIATRGKENVKCTWVGCSSVIRKENRTRHVNETHWRKIKSVCTLCERGFSRPYMKEKHERTCRGPRSK